MSKWYMAIVAALVTLSFAACSSPEKAPSVEVDKPTIDVQAIDEALKNAPPPAAPAPEVTPPAAAPAPAPVVEPAPAPEAAPAADAAAAVPGELDATHAKLIGTSWMVGDVEANFTDKDSVMLKGGIVATLAPDGLEADYTFADGKVELNAAGNTKSGTWDGTALVIDGTVATKK